MHHIQISKYLMVKILFIFKNIYIYKYLYNYLFIKFCFKTYLIGIFPSMELLNLTRLI